MPPLKRSGVLRGWASAAAKALLGPLEKLACAGSRLFEPAPRVRAPRDSVKRSHG